MEPVNDRTERVVHRVTVPYGHAGLTLESFSGEDIATALACLQGYAQLQREQEAVEQERNQAVALIRHLGEYWNGSANERAMQDACEHIQDECAEFLKHCGLPQKTPLTWTSARPTVEGWYWWRPAIGCDEETCILEVFKSAGQLVVDGMNESDIIEGVQSIAATSGHWAGPIQPPGGK